MKSHVDADEAVKDVNVVDDMEEDEDDKDNADVLCGFLSGFMRS